MGGVSIDIVGGVSIASEKLWKKMDRLAFDSKYNYGEAFGEREILFMNLLKEAYDQDLELIVSCVYDDYDIHSSTRGHLMARQNYLDVDGGRFLICFTSEKRAEEAPYDADWSIVKARDVMNNMFNRTVTRGLVFNPNDKRMVIIFKELLSLTIPGNKPKPEFFEETIEYK